MLLAGNRVTDNAFYRRLTVVFSLVFWIASIAGSFGMIEACKISNLFVWFTYSAGLYFIGLLALKVFVADNGHAFFGIKGFGALCSVIVFSMVAALFLEGLTLMGSPSSDLLNIKDWQLKRLVIFSLLVFAFTTLGFSRANAGTYLFSETKRFKLRFFRCGLGKKIIAAIVSLICAVLLCCLLGLKFVPALSFFAALLISLIVICLSRAALDRPEWVFIAIALPMGMVMSVQIPAMTGMSWDDQIHYGNALRLSYVTSPELTDEELLMIDMANLRSLGQETGVGLDDWKSEEIDSYYEKIDSRYKDDAASGGVTVSYLPDQLLSFVSLGYIPSAIGLWLGRALSLPFHMVFIMGRVANLIAYCLGCFCAIRLAPAKKTLFTVVSLIPVNLFLASSYAYDPWVVSMLLLGASVLYREMWQEDSAICIQQVALAAGIMFLGLCVKAVYFPIIGLFFLMPKSKFTGMAQRKRYYLFVVLFGLFVLASFAMPFLFGVSSGAEVGDSRGGSDVSASGQLSFILNNPMDYSSILSRFLINTYFNPANSSWYVFSFAYLSDGFFGQIVGNPLLNYLPVIVLAAVSLFDNAEKAAWMHASAIGSIWSGVIYVLTCVLVATALYVSFTPVGLDTINGCQFRYQLPLIAPILAVLFNYHKPLGMEKGTKIAVYLLSLLAIAFCVYIYVIARYPL